jgi:hypothetical protein
MIVRPLPEGWKVYFHRNHALLATQIALRWKREEGLERVAETVAAIAQHDDLEHELEDDHLTPAGAPMDYTLRDRDDRTEIPRWEQLLEDALHRSRWVALLTAMHVCFLNQDKRGDSERLDRFCQQIDDQATRWRKELGIEAAEVERGYAFLQWCDRLSLILIQEELPRAERRLEISAGPDGTRYHLLQREGDGTITVDPWPFAEERFTLQAESRALNRLAFPSNAALQKALKDAPVQTEEWVFQK